MTFKAVPPKESITPRRKQRMYEVANLLYDYALELQREVQSEEDPAEQDLINEELALLEKLNAFQVDQIEKLP